MNNFLFRLTNIITHQTLLKSNKTLSGQFRNYAFKSDLKIKWVRPEKIPCFKPEKSGDLEGLPTHDQSQFQLEYRNCKELETADDLVKKLLSLEFAPGKSIARLNVRCIMDRVQNHKYDEGSIEAKIARWTGVIRAWQELMERFPRNVKLKVKLKELIDKRKKHLKYLRRWDYKRFEWLLETLNLVYKPPPNHFHWITRKESLKKLTDKYCDNLRQERLNRYKLQLQAEQPAFLQEKIRCLEFIRQEQKDCNVDVTVTQEEIDTIKMKLKKLEDSNSKSS